MPSEAKWKSLALAFAVLFLLSAIWGYARVPSGSMVVPEEEYTILKSSISALQKENDKLKIELAQIKKELEQVRKEKGKTVGDFTYTGEELCTSDGKPVVYFFGTSWCPHCRWEKPIIKQVASEFSNSIDFRFYELDLQSAPEEDMKVFRKFSPNGAVPTLVFGCSYYRVGSGENFGEEAEAEALRALLCKITQSKAEVCKKYAGIIAGIP
jgi:thiol-disulfide isomerase/thioredoxin